MKIAVRLDLSLPAPSSGAKTPERSAAFAIEKALEALGNAKASDAPKGILRDELGAPCGSWEVSDAEELPAKKDEPKP